jgi:hypothetical protein
MKKLFIGILLGLIIATTVPGENFLKKNEKVITKTKDKILDFYDIIVDKVKG